MKYSYVVAPSASLEVCGAPGTDSCDHARHFGWTAPAETFDQRTGMYPEPQLLNERPKVHINALAEEIERLRGQITEGVAVNAQLRDELEDRNSKLRDADAEMADRAKRIRALTADNADRRSLSERRIDGLTAQLEQRDARVQSLLNEQRDLADKLHAARDLAQNRTDQYERLLAELPGAEGRPIKEITEDVLKDLARYQHPYWDSTNYDTVRKSRALLESLGFHVPVHPTEVKYAEDLRTRADRMLAEANAVAPEETR